MPAGPPGTGAGSAAGHASPTRLAVFADGLAEAGWLASLVLAPLFFDPYTSRVFEPDKQVLLRVLAWLMASAWCLRRIETGRWQGSRGDGMPRRAVPLAWPVGALVGATFISCSLSLQPALSWLGSHARGQGGLALLAGTILFALLATGLRGRPQLRRVVDALLAASVPVALYAVIQRVDADPFVWEQTVGARVSSTLGNPIFLAATLAMASFPALDRLLSAWAQWRGSSPARRADAARVALYAAVLALLWTALALADSRGPWLAWALALAVFALGRLALLVREGEQAAIAAGLPPPKRLGAREAIFALVCALALGGIAAIVAVAMHRWGPGESGGRLGAAAVAGVAVALLPMVFLALARRPLSTWAWATIPALALVGAFGLAVAASGWLPFGQVGNAGSAGLRGQMDGGRSGQARVLIWDGAIALGRPHPPFRDVAGRPDPLNAWRPWIGHGPETFFVVFPQVYPPRLAWLDARDASPDRAHNAGYDALVGTGVLGWLAWQGVFIAVFQLGLRLLGAGARRRSARMIVGVLAAGGLAGALGSGLLVGWAFASAGWSIGVAAGVGWSMARIAIGGAGEAPSGGQADPLDRPFVLALLAGVLCHFLEVGTTGIATAATSTLFWVFAGLLSALAGGGGATLRARPQRAAAAHAPGLDRHARRATADLLAAAMLAALVLAMLAYAFLAAPLALRAWRGGVGALLAAASWQLPLHGVATSWAVPGLMAASGLAAVGIPLLELHRRGGAGTGEIAAALGRMAGVAAGITGLLALGLATYLVHVDLPMCAPVAANVPACAAAIARVPAFAVGFVLAWSLAMAVILARRPRAVRGAWATRAGMVAAPVLAILLWAGWQVGGVGGVQADAVHRQAEVHRVAGKARLARELEYEAMRRAPGDAFHAAAFADAALRQALATPPGSARTADQDAARGALERARQLAPFDADTPANLGRLARTVAAGERDPDRRREQLAQGSAAFAEALALSPRRAGLWNDAAELALDRADFEATQGNAQAAAAALGLADDAIDRSLGLDPDYGVGYRLRGRLHVLRGQAAQAVADVEQALARDPASAASWEALGALAAAGQAPAVEAVARRHLDPPPGQVAALRLLVADVCLPQGRLDEAIALQRQVVASVHTPGEVAVEQLALAMLLASTGQAREALDLSRFSLANLPAARQADARELIDMLGADIDAQGADAGVR